MITRDEALDRARAWMSVGRGDEPQIGLHEFDLGWVAWPVVPASDDPTRPPAVTGGPQIVIDRETGEISRWPALPAPTVAARYATTRAAGNRFPADVSRVLVDAGWSPGRDVAAAVDAWAQETAEQLDPFPFFPAARAALAEFGGLVLPQYDGDGKLGGGFTSHLYPTTAGFFADRAEGFDDDYGFAVFPLGFSEDDGAVIAMDEQGRVFFLHWGDEFLIGADIDAAVVSLVRGGPWPSAESAAR
ncbi:SUKH-3 domain-containing protein [Krasilnikovia sp. MM14-A1259]|uniref:SUKH-3 domain-containing protein n=1 Tax=Krasilnikovia sp. MM14-A1259 TaxID=3373539 RepID=UPI003808766C